jgi:hypothetical protein
VKRLLKQLAVTLAVAAVAVPLARATDYDGYKSGYPQLHATLSHQVAAPPVRTAERGFVWRDAAIGAAAAAGFILLLAGGAVSLNRRRTRLALGQANGVISP